MSGQHIPIARLQAAAEEIAESSSLNQEDSEHLRICAECGEMLTLFMRKHERAQILAQRSLGPEHLAIRKLWDFSRSKELNDAELQHMKNCEDCIGVLQFCRTAPSLHELIWTLKDNGIEL